MISSGCTLRTCPCSGPHSLPQNSAPHSAKSPMLSLRPHPQIPSGPALRSYPCSCSLTCSRMHHPRSDHVELMICRHTRMRLAQVCSGYLRVVYSPSGSPQDALSGRALQRQPGHTLSILAAFKCAASAQVRSSYLFTKCTPGCVRAPVPGHILRISHHAQMLRSTSLRMYPQDAPIARVSSRYALRTSLCSSSQVQSHPLELSPAQVCLGYVRVEQRLVSYYR